MTRHTITRSGCRYTIHRSGQDNWCPRAQSGLSREYVDGELAGKLRPAGEPSLWQGFALLLLPLAAFAAIWAMVPA